MRPIRWGNVVAAAGIVASGYGFFHTNEPSNYLCWGLIFLYCFCEKK